jgi:glucose uptake protein
MSAGFLTWLAGAMAVFLAASASMRAYVDNERLGLLGFALILYTAGNLMMVRLMREGGMAVAISVSAVLQLLLAVLVAFLFFGERPGTLQLAGIALGVVAVALILAPQGAGR